jgi:hypothetical protein
MNIYVPSPISGYNAAGVYIGPRRAELRNFAGVVQICEGEANPLRRPPQMRVVGAGYRSKDV